MRRPALLGAAWLGAAAAAVGLGFLAVSFVGASASPDASLLAATGSVATSSPAASPATSSELPAATTARQVTPGGTVVADCSRGTAALGGAPAAGWWTEDPTDRDAVEFTNGGQTIEVRATCVNGSPSFVVEAPKVAAQRSTAVPASPTTEDKGGGRGGGGGGHGSDG
jgi:hypothetical protein